MTVEFSHTGSDATTWTWEFGDGSVVSNETGTITHTYTTPGAYSVSLTVGNGTNYASKMKPQFIHFQPVQNEEYTDNFDNGTADWHIENPDNGNGWFPVMNYLYAGNTIMMIDNYSKNDNGEKDMMRSRSFDTEGWSGVEVNFDVSYKVKGFTSTFFFADTLEVAYSTDCGATYQTAYLKTGLDLATTSDVNALKWFPASVTDDWRTEAFTLPAGVVGETLHFKIINRSREGNFLYIDNFAVKNTLVLPAELTHFEVTTDEKNGTEIKWTTATEQNVDFFGIEYSPDGATWNTSKRISAVGNSSTEQHYDTHIELPAGDWKVRLTINDFDGSTAYSQVRSVSKLSEEKLKVFPNPVAEFLTLKSTQNETARLIDVQGRTVKIIEISADTPQEVDMSDVVSGVYFLQTRKENIRVVKMSH